MTYNILSEPSWYSSSGGTIPAGVHIGIVKSTNSSTKSVMVLVPSINDTDVIGPCRVVVPLISGAAAVLPPVNTKVVIAFLDGDYQQAVCLGKLT